MGANMKKKSFLFIFTYLISLCLLMSCDTREDSFSASNCYLKSGNTIQLYYSGYYNNVDFRLYHLDPMTGEKNEHAVASILNRPFSSYLTISYKGDIPEDCVILLYVYKGTGLDSIVTVKREK